MRILVADIGGTNSRLALASDTGLDTASIRRFANDDFASFDDVARHYLEAIEIGPIEALCVAMAGPVAGGRGTITNRGWHLEIDALQALTGARHAMLINDLQALGYATVGLPKDARQHLCGLPERPAQNGQSLVIGVATGFNICPVKVLPGGAIACHESESGHADMPRCVAEALAQAFGAAGAGIDSVEECFSGRGLARLFARVMQTDERPGAEIVALCAEGSDPAATAFMKSYSVALGMVCRELVLQLMPLDGVYLAGSVARGVFSCGHSADFVSSLTDYRKFAATLSDIPVHLIESDTAPLIGCVEAARGLVG